MYKNKNVQGAKEGKFDIEISCADIHDGVKKKIIYAHNKREK